MNVYRSKPVMCEALQWDGSYESTEAVMDEAYVRGKGDTGLELWVAASDGWCALHEGDYIVRENPNPWARQQHYPVLQATFESRWEPT